IDAGDIELTGDGGLVAGLIKAALERGLQAELTDHVGYEKGAAEAGEFTNSRNGTSTKTIASEIGDIELAIPRDRERSEEHTSELQSRFDLVCRLLLEKKKIETSTASIGT